MKLVPDVAVLYELDGKPRRLDYRKVSFHAWSQVKQAGFTPMTLIDEGLAKYDLDAIGCLVFLDRAQTNRRLSLSDVVHDLMTSDDAEFELIDILSEGRSLLGEDDEGEEPDEDPTTSGS